MMARIESGVRCFLNHQHQTRQHLFFKDEDLPTGGKGAGERYFRTFQLRLALLARVLDGRLAGRRVADGAGGEGSALALDANQRSIWRVCQFAVYTWGDWAYTMMFAARHTVAPYASFTSPLLTVDQHPSIR